MRFKVRRATKGWLVWDTKTNTVAVVDHYSAIELSAETANRFAHILNERDKRLSETKEGN